jgi:hypothetical protein
VFQWEESSGRATKKSFAGATNSDTWQGAAAGEALCDDISYYDEYIQGAWWWGCTYRIYIKPFKPINLPHGGSTEVGGYNPEYVLNAGPLAIVTDPVTGNKARKPIVRNGWYDGRPALLAADGSELPTDPATGLYTADPIFLQFQTKNIVAFSGLNLTPPAGW